MSVSEQSVIEFLHATSPAMATKLTRERMWLVHSIHSLARENDNLRGLIAECLALNPTVCGDMQEIRAWADVLRRMKKAALPEEASDDRS